MSWDIAGLTGSHLYGERAKYDSSGKSTTGGARQEGSHRGPGCWPVPGALVPAVPLTRPFAGISSCHLRGPAEQEPVGFSVLLPLLCRRNLHCLFLGSVEEGWGEALLLLKMFLLNILILPRHQSLYLPFSPYHILPLRPKPSCLSVSWWWGGGLGGQKEAPGRKNIGHYLQNVSCCIIVVDLEIATPQGAEHTTCKYYIVNDSGLQPRSLKWQFMSIKQK